jgi:hypothetical protein
MSKQINQKPAAGHEITAVSLVAVVACALAGDALASPSKAHTGAELSTRIAIIAERIRLHEPARVRELPTEGRIAWRN